MQAGLLAEESGHHLNHKMFDLKFVLPTRIAKGIDGTKTECNFQPMTGSLDITDIRIFDLSQKQNVYPVLYNSNSIHSSACMRR